MRIQSLGTYRYVNLHVFLGLIRLAALADGPIEPTLDIIVRRLETNGLILLLVVVIPFFHDDDLGWTLSLKDLRKRAQWIPMRLIAVNLAQSFICILAFAS